MSGIFVGAKEANLGFETGKAHSYLVYENDAGARFVTSLTDAQRDLFPPSLRFDVEQINTPYDQAEESREPNRVERPLDLGGRNADAVWILITEHAEAIKDEKPVYDPLTQNSNSFVASLLNVVGIDLDHNLPGFDGKQPTSNPHPSDYPGLHNLLDFDYHLVGTDSRDIIRGAGGDDHLWGKGDDDTLVGNKGSDTLDGGSGIDTFAWTNFNHGHDTIADFTPATDRLQLDTIGTEFDGSEALVAQFVRIVPAGGGQDGLLQVDADGAGAGSGWQNLAKLQGQPNLHTQALYRVGDLVIDDHVLSEPFDPLAYVASYDDLIRAFGTDAHAGRLHYLTYGFDEQRSSTFDGLQYIATYGDLIDAYGPGRDAGTAHFINNGLDEQRLRDDFDEVQYVANYKDLQDAFGTDYEAATRHYITNGYHELRTDEPLDATSLQVVASDEAEVSAAGLDFLL